MRVHIANYEPDRSGGGWTFQRNFTKVIPQASYEDADIYMIAGASMVSIDDAKKAKAEGKKVILRADNMPRRSRNARWVDDQGKTKIKALAEIADLVIYQSKWARDFLYPHLLVDGPVILNGVDTTIYNPDNRNAAPDSYLYARSSRDEGKNWIFAWYWFVNKKGTLEIAGRFSPENLKHNFDFYNNERYTFVGEQPSLVDSYKRNMFFLYTYLNDACSNTLIEALASGCQIIDVYGMLQTGGAPEIMELKDLSLERMCEEYDEALRSIN